MSVMVQKNIRESNFHHPDIGNTTNVNMMMLSSRRNENIECCFICGANQAIWLLNSNPTTDNKPFFPFLQYQKPPLNANKLDSIGRCLTCNVCYLFLIQQWKTYQEGKVPIHKRLYWMKRPTDEYNIGKCPNEMTPMNNNNTGSRDVIQKHYTPSSRTLGSMTSDTERNYYGEEDEEKNIDKQLENEFIPCSLCTAKEKNESMKYILTTSQTSLDVPFYSKIIIGKDGNPKADCDERILVCLQCHSTLYRQWLEFEKLSIPRHDREFIIIPVGTDLSDAESLACFLCHDVLPQDAHQPLYCKKISDEPFFPFLKNLAKSYNTCPLRESGVTSSCKKCKVFLRKQWDIFQECNVPQEERVYRIHPSQSPLVPSEIELDKSIACFICSAKNNVKSSKRIYCNSGSNMNLSFLKSFPRNKDGFFSEETGETFVCISCFKELKQHWIKYRSTLFESPLLMHVNEASFTSKTKLQTISGCEICNVKLSGDAIMQLNILPMVNNNNNNEEEKPFFPSLKELRQTDDKSPLSACQLCFLNLLNQWSSFETSKDVNVVSRYERSYKFQEFTCYACSAVVPRGSVELEDMNNIKDGVEIQANKLAVKFNNSVSLCNECKTRCIKPKEITSESLGDNKIDQIEPVVKVIATVPPFIGCSSKNLNPPTATSSTTQLSSSSSEGSFAAALRKLAQQPPILPVTLRDKRRESPTLNIIPTRPQLSTHITGTPSILAPVYSHMNIEKQEIKPTYSQMHSREHEQEVKDVTCRYPDRIASDVFPFRSREEQHHRISQDKYEANPRDVFDLSHPISSSNIIGLAHPQPTRKAHEEDKIKSTTHKVITPFSSYGAFVPPQHQHPHGAQSSCPVHGHEGSHQHTHKHQHTHEIGHKHDHSQSQGTQFDPSNHTTRDFHRTQHPRLHEELQFVHGRRVPAHHPLEKDLRRSGMDHRWPVLPHLPDEQYRQHVSIAHEHSPFTTKDPRGQVYMPQFYYGREYPIAVDPYLTHGMPSDTTIQHHGPLISPRVFKDYYRRNEQDLAERIHREAEKRPEERKEDAKFVMQASIDYFGNQRKHEEINVEKYVSPEKKEDDKHCVRYLKDNLNGGHNMPFFREMEVNTDLPKTNESISESVCDNSLSVKLSDVKSELDAASVLVNMNSINQSPHSHQVTNNHPTVEKPIKVEDDEEEWTSEEKATYMDILGLVTHSRKRELEEDYEHKRWDRKFKKNQPKKRTKRENAEGSSDNGDSRPNSELDFYSGPMTRHMQQLLLEQECLLEQIQKQNTNVRDPNDDNTIGNQQSTKSPPHSDTENINTSSACDSLGNILSSTKATKEADHGEIVDKQGQYHELIDGIKLLDNSLFGETVHETNVNNRNCAKWCGVEHISNAYLAYIPEYDLKRKQLIKRCKELEHENMSLQQKREYIEKNLLAYKNRSRNISDERQEVHGNLENINVLLRSMLNL